jgi:hypothetical protein
MIEGHVELERVPGVPNTRRRVMVKTRGLVRNILAAGACILVAFLCPRASDAEPVASGMDLPQLTLQAPESADSQQYLGLKGPEPFSLSEIPAKLIIMEVFYILCLDCQKAAPSVNTLFGFIQNDPELSKNVKMFGVGMRSDHKKLRTYQASFHTKFPLLPDPENEVFTKLGEPKIPFLMLINDTGKVLLTHHGQIKDVDAFFSEIKELYSRQ